MPSYFIESDSRRIGFIGLYYLRPGKSAEMTLMIFDNNNRRMGYGTKAFTIFIYTLKRYSLIEEIIVKVKTGNHASISFWTKLGFEELYSLNGIKVMSMDLKSNV